MINNKNKVITPTEVSEFHGGLHFRTTILVDEEKYVVDTALIPGLLSVFEGEYETMVFRGHDDDDSFDSKDLDCDRCEENALKGFRMHEAMIQRWLSGESRGCRYCDDKDEYGNDDEEDKFGDDEEDYDNEDEDDDDYMDDEEEIEIIEDPEGTDLSGKSDKKGD